MRTTYRTLLTLLALAAILLAVGLTWAADGYTYLGPVQSDTPTGAVITTLSATSCEESAVAHDDRGTYGCPTETNTAPRSLAVFPAASYARGTQTESNLILTGGQPEYTITVDTQANASGDTVTIYVTTASTLFDSTTLTEGTDFDCLIDEATCCTAFAVAVDAISGISASCTGATMYIMPAAGTVQVGLSSASDAWTESTAQNGDIMIPTGALVRYNRQGVAVSAWSATEIRHRLFGIITSLTTIPTPAADQLRIYLASGGSGVACSAYDVLAGHFGDTGNRCVQDANGALYAGGGMGVAFANLGSPSDGAMQYCTDCTKATPCAGSGSGALAKRINGAWDCD